MQDFENKLDNILLEAKNVSNNDVIDAINNRYRVIINYDDERENAPTGNRLIEPYVFGISTAGNEVIRSFQYHGATRRGVPKYKLFRLDRILNWQPRPNDHFYAEPKKLAVVAPDYNENGDIKMTQVIAQVHFTKKEEAITSTNTNTDKWQSPLSKVKMEREKLQQNINRQINNQPNKEGAINTKGLKKELNKDKGELEKDIDNTLNIKQVNNKNRGALKISPQIYDQSNQTSQERRDKDIMYKRDSRWQQAADTRPIHRKGSLNNELNKIFGIEDENNEEENEI